MNIVLAILINLLAALFNFGVYLGAGTDFSLFASGVSTGVVMFLSIHGIIKLQEDKHEEN